MSKKVGVVHTSFALVEPLKALAGEMLPGIGLINIVDDTLLPYAREHGVDEKLRRRMCNYFQGRHRGGVGGRAVSRSHRLRASFDGAAGAAVGKSSRGAGVVESASGPAAFGGNAPCAGE